MPETVLEARPNAYPKTSAVETGRNVRKMKSQIGATPFAGQSDPCSAALILLIPTHHRRARVNGAMPEKALEAQPNAYLKSSAVETNQNVHWTKNLLGAS